MAAILDPPEFGRLLADIDTYAGTFIVIPGDIPGVLLMGVY